MALMDGGFVDVAGIWKPEPLAPDVVSALDPGIREFVVALNAAGFETTDSGDGVSKPPGEGIVPFAHVAIVVSKHVLAKEADRLCEWMVSRGLEVSAQGLRGGEAEWYIEASYDPRVEDAMIFVGRP